MLNKKGVTLAEVIISIALISVVLVFMVKLLIELNNAETNTTYAGGNQIVRAEILRTINNDLLNKTLVNVSDNNSNKDNLMITFRFSDNSYSVINATKSTLDYNIYNSSGVLQSNRSWDLLDCNIYVDEANVYYMKDQNIFTMTIDIEIHTVNERNDHDFNNPIDDISISYIGNSANFSTSALNCLGYCCKNTC